MALTKIKISNIADADIGTGADQLVQRDSSGDIAGVLGSSDIGVTIQGFDTDLSTVATQGLGASANQIPQLNASAQLPAVSGTNLTSLPAGNLSGILPAISGASLTDLPASGGVINVVADGVMADGNKVILQSDGTVKGVGMFPGDPGAGTTATFNADTISFTAPVFDSNSNKIVIFYYQGPYMYAVVTTISGTSLSFGTPLAFYASSDVGWPIACFDSNTNKVVVTFSGESADGFTMVGTVSGTSISFGTSTEWPTTNSLYQSICFDSNTNKVVVVYTNEDSSNYGTAIVGTVSGTTISFGTPVVFFSGEARENSCTFDSNTNKVVVVYKNGSGNKGTGIVGTVSGTSISFGSPTTFTSAGTDQQAYDTSSVFDSNSNKVVISYRNAYTPSGGVQDNGTAIVATVSGTSISFGTPVIFSTEQLYAGSAKHRSQWITFDSNLNKVVISYTPSSTTPSRVAKGIVGTVSGTSISFGTSVVFDATGSIAYPSIAFDSNVNKSVVAWSPSAAEGHAAVFETAALQTNLTSTNFIGISDGAYADTATAKIQVTGATNEAQSGLTTGALHYVQGDGTLSTTAGSPSVYAGIALSATKLLVKG